MTDQFAETVRKPRADAVRNRERVLEAAKAVFSAGGPDASLEAVAKRAGVGIGTLYRHFPTREALFEAVYRREVEQLGELAEQLKSEAAPVDEDALVTPPNGVSDPATFGATATGNVSGLFFAGADTPLHYTFDQTHLANLPALTSSGAAVSYSFSTLNGVETLTATATINNVATTVFTPTVSPS